jgi:hypothetical protein
MREIKEVLDLEIKAGLINWDKLSEKIHAALNCVDNKFDVIRDTDGKATKMRINDALTFKMKDKASMMIIKPRFQDGKLICSGIRKGILDLKGIPFFPNPPEMF